MENENNIKKEIKENENNDKNNKNKKSIFKKITALALSCILIGGAGGFAIGFCTPLIQKIVLPQIKNYTYKTVTSFARKSKPDKIISDAAFKNETPISKNSDNSVKIIKSVKPSIVCITTTIKLKDMFNIPYLESGAGSGIIFAQTDEKVYIVTNSHVIDGASAVGVSVENSGVVPAELIGKKETADIAVISIKKSDLIRVGVNKVTAAKFGNSDNLNMGDSVIAIGNALGNGNTATSGIVSAVNKEINIDGLTLNVIQTDAAINPGNSGGALINVKGEVIGINTAKLASTEIESTGYSISINVAKPIIENIMNHTSAPYLGVYISKIDEEEAEAYGLPVTGVIVEDVIQNSSAERAGIQKNDIITVFNDTPVFTPEQLTNAVQNCRVGDTVEVRIIRNAHEMITLKVKLYSSSNNTF